MTEPDIEVSATSATTENEEVPWCTCAVNEDLGDFLFLGSGDQGMCVACGKPPVSFYNKKDQ